MPRRRNHEAEPRAMEVEEPRRTLLVRPKEKERVQTVVDYIRYFDRVVTANGWDDMEAGKVFAAMIGPTDRCLDSLEKWETFSELKEILLEKQKPLREARLTELMHLKIGEGERIEELKDRVTKLVAETYSEFDLRVQHQLIRDHFLHALPDDVKMQVLIAKPVTLDDTVNIALASVLLLDKEKLSVCAVASGGTSTLERATNEHFQRNFTVQDRKFKPTKNKGKSDVQCYKCQGFGHIQRFCPNKSFQQAVADVTEENNLENNLLLRTMGQSQ